MIFLNEMEELHKAIDEITEIAKGFGLDFFPMRYEICPAHIIYQLGAYGMPTRYSHWSFGKQYYKMKLHYDLGLSQIYELVINSDPCYAFLLDTNTLTQNKLIVAHVLAHSDFFKNNYYFKKTRRDMVESMAASAERIAFYEREYGKEKVESFLDAVLSIQEHIDPYGIDSVTLDESTRPKMKTAYDDLFFDEADEEEKEASSKAKRFPRRPVKDLLLFIEKHSPMLEDWQCDILTTVREEMLYFWPQLETKIMNEGWATYWHQRIMRELDLGDDELIEYAKLNANVVQRSKTHINPYYLGLKLFEHIEYMYDNPTEEMKRQGVKENSGREKIFEVREIENDTSFLRNYLTEDFVKNEDMFIFENEGGLYRITDKQFESIRQELITSRTNGGFPYIVVQDANYVNNGELYLKHEYEGIELDLKHLENVLPNIYQLWGKTVHFETVVDEQKMLFSYNGIKQFQRKLHN